MRDCVLWYREGPQWRHYRQYSNPWQVSVLDREISSCEPCFSWNIWHTLQLGDRERFTMGLYGLLAGGASQTTFVSCETREGTFGNTFSTMVFIPLMVASTIEEQGDTLHLMRMTPIAFLRDGGIDWREVATSFGPVSIKAELDDDGRRMNVRWQGPQRIRPERVVLHIPPIAGLESVQINGKPSIINAGTVEIC